jgi:hypothetical protein
VKNTFGLSVSMQSSRQNAHIEENSFTGSALDRKKKLPKEITISEEHEETKEDSQKSVTASTYIDMETGEEITIENEIKLKTMSQRTKSKIRKKILSFAQIFAHLTFVTLTFANLIQDEIAVVILRKFLDNMKKRLPHFEYLWVAERQNKNKVFDGNIHFHLVTNIFWDIKKTWKYWLDVQAKNGILPRDENYKPSSAFDVKRVTASKNIKNVSLYLTKYVTKNKAEFKSQVWNCSKMISELYTDFYTSIEFLDELHRLKGSDIKVIEKDYCNLHLIPFDKTTIPFYDRLGIKNKDHLNNHI